MVCDGGAQPALTSFQQDALKAIYAVLPYQRETFTLSPSQDPVPVILYSAAATPEKLDYERVQCASNATFHILSQANEAGIIAVSVCPEHVARLRRLAATSTQGFDTMLALLQKAGSPLPPDKLRSMGWYREQSGLSGGGEFHYMAIIAVGHGIAVLPTVLLLTDTQAVVVQAETSRLCGFDGPTPSPKPFPLCSDPKGTLNVIAQRLLR